MMKEENERQWFILCHVCHHYVCYCTQPSGAVDSLDAKIERLIRDWNHGSDMLFSIHPADGSLLIWLVGFN